MVVDAIIEGGKLSSLAIIIDILLNLSVLALVEFIIYTWLGDESSIGSIIHFVGGIAELGDMVESFDLLSTILELIVAEVIRPANSVVNLTGCIVIIPFHGWVISQKSFKFGQLKDTGLVWKSGG